MKLSADATVIYSTFVADAGAILIGADDQAIVAGNGPAPGLPPPPSGTSPDLRHEIRLHGFPRGSGRLHSRNGLCQSAPSALAADSSGNLVVFGTIYGITFPITHGAYNYPVAADVRRSAEFMSVSSERRTGIRYTAPSCLVSASRDLRRWTARAPSSSLQKLGWGFPCAIRCWPRPLAPSIFRNSAHVGRHCPVKCGWFHTRLRFISRYLRRAAHRARGRWVYLRGSCQRQLR